MFMYHTSCILTPPGGRSNDFRTNFVRSEIQENVSNQLTKALNHLESYHFDGPLDSNLSHEIIIALANLKRIKQKASDILLVEISC